MPSLNKDTGKLYGTSLLQQALDLEQSVADRVLTAPGSQPHRPRYGSLASRIGGRDLIDTVTSIQRALRGQRGDPRVRSLRFIRSGPRLRVLVNPEGGAGRVEINI